jgi:hypothetical protein
LTGTHPLQTTHKPRAPRKKPSQMGEFWKSLAGVALGGVIAAGTAYFSARWSADYQHQQFLFERAQSFGEFFALQYLPRSGDVPQECQTRLEECRRLRQAAVQIYLFTPSAIQADLIRSYGENAVQAASPQSIKLTPESKAFHDALSGLRNWIWGSTENNFNFILPCADWKNEEKSCRKS